MPNHLGAARCARSTAAREYAITSSRDLKVYCGSVFSLSRTARTSEVPKLRRAISAISPSSFAICWRPTRWISSGGTSTVANWRTSAR